MQRGLRAFLCLSLFFLVVKASVLAQQNDLMGKGGIFPQIPMKSPSDSKDQTYLGISKSKFFVLDDIKADLVLVEIMNVNCATCQKQAPIFNSLFSLIESSPEARGRIKILAIAVGNDDKHVKEYRNRFKVPYPVIEDPKFIMWDATGRGPTPFTIFVRQDPSGNAGLIADTHVGLITRNEETFRRMLSMLSTDLSAIKGEAKHIEGKKIRARPIFTEQRLLEKIVAAYFVEGYVVESIKKIKLEKNGIIYTSIGEKDGTTKRLFAKAISLIPPCDLCHDIHFIYIFEETGKILQFIPLLLTKYGNEPWDETDISKMRSQIVGKYIYNPFDFDAEVDAVTSATITSSVIFKSLDEGKTLHKELKRLGLI